MTLWQIGKLVYPDSVRKRLQFFFSTLPHAQEIRSLRGTFRRFGTAPLLAANARIYEKALYPYLFHPQPFGGRMATLLSHYRLLGERLTPEAIDRLAGRGIELAALMVGEEPMTVRLDRIAHFANEGELTVGLYGSGGERYYILSFNVDDREGGRLLIGAMQGPGDIRGEDSREIVKRLTKELHGLRPQILLVAVLQELARMLHLVEILAVRTAGHVYNASSRIKRIKTDYDFFWEEAGGTPLDERFYRLPLAYEKKAMDEIKSNKRAMYRRRFEMLDALEASIASVILPMIKK